jgi:hypothetical protein
MLKGRALANAAGHKVSQDTASGLEATLHAALADEGAAAQLRSGRLTDTLQSTGFPLGTSTTAKPSPDSLSPTTATNSSAERRADQLRRAEREEQLARAEAQQAAESQKEAQAVADRAGTAVRDAASLVKRLRAELDKAQVEQSCREQEHRKSQADLHKANRAAREASRRLEAAMQRGQRSSP